jgi:hypothetical protein
MFSELWVTSQIWESSDATDLNRQVGSISAQNEQIKAFQYCPECGADHYTQRRSRGKLPG